MRSCILSLRFSSFRCTTSTSSAPLSFFGYNKTLVTHSRSPTFSTSTSSTTIPSSTTTLPATSAKQAKEGDHPDVDEDDLPNHPDSATVNCIAPFIQNVSPVMVSEVTHIDELSSITYDLGDDMEGYFDLYDYNDDVDEKFTYGERARGVFQNARIWALGSSGDDNEDDGGGKGSVSKRTNISKKGEDEDEDDDDDEAEDERPDFHTRSTNAFNNTGIVLTPRLPHKLKTIVLEEINAYVNKPNVLEDYHPGSDNKVRDIVHPSLYPYVHGLSELTKEEVMKEVTINQLNRDRVLKSSKKRGGRLKVKGDGVNQNRLGWVGAATGGGGGGGGGGGKSSHGNDDLLKENKTTSNTSAAASEASSLLDAAGFPYTFDPAVVAAQVQPGRRWLFSNNYIEALDFWKRAVSDSLTYQWLPSEFHVDKNGKVTIDSYINNLPSSETKLYSAIASAFEHVLPSFEKSWGFGYSIDFHDDTNYGSPSEMNINPRSLRDRHLQVITKIVRISSAEATSNSLYNTLTFPTPSSASSSSSTTTAVQKDFPSELKGAWHVEGMSHENIVSTCSITLSQTKHDFSTSLYFQRMYTDAELEYIQDDMPQNPPSYITSFLQQPVPLGRLPLQENDIVVFPNSHIHKIDMVNESTKTPSERTILVFWLVNPYQRIISTKHVKEQQVHNKEFTLEKAFEHRLGLMKERTNKKQELNPHHLNLCEH